MSKKKPTTERRLDVTTGGIRDEDLGSLARDISKDDKIYHYCLLY